MVLGLVAKSLWHRKGKVVVAILAIVLAASLASAFLNLFLNVQEKWENELRAYGPNIVLVPEGDAPGTTWYLAEKDTSVLAKSDFSFQIAGYVPFLYALARINGQPVGLAGTWPDAVRKTNPWWKVEGNWIKGRDDLDTAMVGINLANSFRLKPGDNVTVAYGEFSKRFRISGIVSTGSSEDNQVILSLAALQDLTHHKGKVSLIQVRAMEGKGSLAALARELEQAIPGARARTVLQVVEAEKKLLNKIQLLMGFIAAFVLFCSALGVMTTMASSVLERRGEIGLMKALGASSTTIASLFLAEAAFMGAAAGFIGYGLGLALSRLMAYSVFDSSLSADSTAFFLTAGLALAVSLGASLVPVRKATLVEPALVLRGE